MSGMFCQLNYKLFSSTRIVKKRIENEKYRIWPVFSFVVVVFFVVWGFLPFEKKVNRFG
jgi:hypothetical protein